MKKSFHFGWVIVACGAVVLGITHGVVNNCFSLYIIPVSESLGVSRQAFAVCSMIVNLLYAAISFTSGWIYKRLTVKKTLRAASIILPLSYCGYSFCTSMPMFYLCAVGVGVSVSLLTFLPFSIILANWFNERRGQAIGLCFMGSGLGGMVMNTLSAIMLDSFGWQATYRITGIIMFLIIFPLIWFVIRVSPEEMGLTALGSASDAPEQKVFGPKASDAIKTISFAALAGIALSNGVLSCIYNNCIAPKLCDIGYTSLYAGYVMSAYMGGLAVGKIFLGSLYDRIGARKGTIVSMTAMIVGYLALIFSAFQPIHLLLVVGALGTASSNVSFPVLTRYAFGSRDYASINGYLMGCTYVTSSFSTVLANTIFSVTGSYDPAFVLGIALSLLSILLLFATKPVRPEDACA